MSQPRTLWEHLVRAAERVGIAWSALVLAGVVLVLLPANMRAS